MYNMLMTFNKWYDKQKEPYRFLIMLALASPIVTSGLWVDGPGKAVLAGAYAGLLMVPRVLHLMRNDNDLA